jgi:hypothetical protein
LLWRQVTHTEGQGYRPVSLRRLTDSLSSVGDINFSMRIRAASSREKKRKGLYVIEVRKFLGR